MLSHLSAHLMGVPLMIHRPKLDVILAVLGERIGLGAQGMPPLPTTPVRSATTHASGIAVIPVFGTLVKRTMGLEAASGLTSYQAIADELNAALADPSVSGIVLDIDSAGGQANGAFDLADQIFAARQVKPIFAVANDSAFSAAYALASAATKVFVSTTAGVGSIGVIAMHVDQSAKDAQDGLAYTPIFSGEHKNDLSPHGPLSESARAALQGEVDRLYRLFVDTVARNRNCSADAVASTQACLFFGQDAVNAGLADGIATVEQAIAELIDFTHRPGLRGTSRKELQMQPTHPPQNPPTDPMAARVPDAMAADDSPTSNAGSPSPTLTVSQALEIADLCTLAGCPEQIAGFLSAQVPVATVRASLLARKAQSPQVSSYLAPLAASAPLEDLMLKAVQKKLSAQTHQGVTP